MTTALVFRSFSRATMAARASAQASRRAVSSATARASAGTTEASPDPRGGPQQGGQDGAGTGLERLAQVVEGHPAVEGGEGLVEGGPRAERSRARAPKGSQAFERAHELRDRRGAPAGDRGDRRRDGLRRLAGRNEPLHEAGAGRGLALPAGNGGAGTAGHVGVRRGGEPLQERTERGRERGAGRGPGAPRGSPRAGRDPLARRGAGPRGDRGLRRHPWPGGARGRGPPPAGASPAPGPVRMAASAGTARGSLRAEAASIARRATASSSSRTRSRIGGRAARSSIPSSTSSAARRPAGEAPARKDRRGSRTRVAEEPQAGHGGVALGRRVGGEPAQQLLYAPGTGWYDRHDDSLPGPILSRPPRSRSPCSPRP